MNIEEFKKCFNFKENRYFYHITGEDRAEAVLEEGLLVDGTNILDVDNILFTTAIEITPDMLSTFEEDILDEELHEDTLRGLSQMIIIGCSKDLSMLKYSGSVDISICDVTTYFCGEIFLGGAAAGERRGLGNSHKLGTGIAWGWSFGWKQN